MLRLLPVSLLCSGILLCAAELPPEVITLERIRKRMSGILTHQPNYTCLQTIQRWTRDGPKKRMRIEDTLRLEVALVNGREMFAWPGSGRFMDTDIRNIVPSGAIGTGNFAGYSKSVFQSNTARYEYVGDIETPNGSEKKWNFVVPQMLSGFTLRVGDRSAVVGYHGSFWVDSASLDVRRLEVHADDIPYHLQLLSSSGAIEFTRVKIGDEPFLLPSTAETEMVSIDGSASRNHTEFGSCRQYSGDSVVLFDDPSPDLTTPTPLRTFVAPPKLRLHLALESKVDMKTLAIGDPVKALLKRPLRLIDDVIAPKGAVVIGRVTHLSPQQYMRWQGYNVGLTFEKIAWERTEVTARMKLERLSTVSPPMYVLEPSPHASKTEHFNQGIMGSIFFVRTNMPIVLQRGMEMVWMTLDAGGEDTP